MKAHTKTILLRRRFLRGWFVAICCLVACFDQAIAQTPPVAVLVQDKTPPGWFGWNKAGAGTLASIESALQKGLASSGRYSVLTRSQFEAVLAEQNLAYKNVVNNHARLGQLVGTDFIVIAELLSDDKRTDREVIRAYGLTDTQTTLSSQAGLTVSVVDVSSGAVVARQQFLEKLDGSHEALSASLRQAASWLGALELRPLSAADNRFQLRVAPASAGREIRGLDILVDGAFMANTPATLALEGGLRDITIKRSDQVLWSNKLRLTRDFAIEPELGISAGTPAP